jgi:hypothetical protein
MLYFIKELIMFKYHRFKLEHKYKFCRKSEIKRTKNVLYKYCINCYLKKD